MASRDVPDDYADAMLAVAGPLDRQLSPLGLAAIDALDPRPGEWILDVGCGAGQTLLQLADRVGPSGRVVGIDREPKLLEVAAARAAGFAQVSFLQSDAQTATFPDRRFDRLYSRFGVMAFADPVTAFGNLREALRPRARLAFTCWRSIEENELDWLPLRASGFEQLADRAPFRFADVDRVTATLTAAGFSNIAIWPNDMSVSCGGVTATLRVVTRVGALGRILRRHPALRARAEPRVRSALRDRFDGAAVHLNAATWVTAGR